MSESKDVSTLRELRATFSAADRMQDAVSRLHMAGFDRAELSLPEPGAGLASASAPATTPEDAQQVRTLGASTAATVAALAAVGVTVATGGAAAPAFAAAVLAGGTAGGAVFAAHAANDRTEQHDRDDRATEGGLILVVRTTTDARHAEAERILRDAGSISIEMTN